MGLDKDYVEKGALEERVFTPKPFCDLDVGVEIARCGICGYVVDNIMIIPKIPNFYPEDSMPIFSEVDGVKQIIPSVSATKLPEPPSRTSMTSKSVSVLNNASA